MSQTCCPIVCSSFSCKMKSKIRRGIGFEQYAVQDLEDYPVIHMQYTAARAKTRLNVAIPAEASRRSDAAYAQTFFEHILVPWCFVIAVRSMSRALKVQDSN